MLDAPNKYLSLDVKNIEFTWLEHEEIDKLELYAFLFTFGVILWCDMRAVQ